MYLIKASKILAKLISNLKTGNLKLDFPMLKALIRAYCFTESV